MEYLPASAHGNIYLPLHMAIYTCNNYLHLHMQYSPASAHAIFTCLLTCNIFLPLHMQYLPASAHVIFTCLCTQRWDRRGCWTSELSPEPGPSYFTLAHTGVHSRVQRVQSDNLKLSSLVSWCGHRALFVCFSYFFLSLLSENIFSSLLFKYIDTCFILFFSLFFFLFFFIADDNMRKQFSFLSVHTYKNPAGLSPRLLGVRACTTE